MIWLWVVIGFIVSVLIGVDVAKNPQSYRNLGLRLSDGCRSLWFWPGRLNDTLGYHGRHRRNDPLPDFMWCWQPPRPWAVLRKGSS
jgi:hypothetical protein